VNNEFWISRWAGNRIGFHKDGVQPLLVRFWPEAAGGTRRERVLVPLAGKSHDMIWLAARGHEVVGVELSGIARRSFAAEHGLDFTLVDTPRFQEMRSGRIRYLVGDFFDLTPEDAGRFALVYDRAALIALPPETRGAYAAKLKSLLDIDAHILLITIEYYPDAMQGPPYSVDEAEVRALFAGCSVGKLAREDCPEDEPRLGERGLKWMKEAVYHVRVGAAGPGPSRLR
jgi:thiopurine S-methyltransferase